MIKRIILSFGTLLFLTCSHSGHAQEFGNISGIPDKDKQQEALYYDAIRARITGDEKQSEELLKQLIREQPNEGAPYYDLSRLYARQNKFEEAEESIKKAVALNGENPWYQSQYAEILAFRDDYEKAAGIYEKLAEGEKYNEDHLLKSALYYQKAAKYKEALKVLDKLIKKTGADEALLMQEQQMYLKLNDMGNAVKIAEQLIAQNPDEGGFVANLAELYDSNNLPEKALELYNKAIKDFPNDPTIQMGLAQYHKKHKNMPLYETYMERAILNPSIEMEFQLNLLSNYILEIIGDTLNGKQKALSITEKLVTQYPTNAPLLALYGQVLVENKQVENGLLQYKKAVQIEPAKFSIWQQILFSYTARKDADSLILYSEKALRFFPNQATVHYMNGIGYYNKADYKKAATVINRAIELQPDDAQNASVLAEMHSTLGDVYNSLKQYENSDNSFEAALKLAPGNPTVLNNYSYYLSVRGVQLEKAESMSKQSLKLRPNEATFLDTYGWILYKQGKYADSKKYIEDAMKGAPDADGTLWEHLGDVYFKLGETEKAVEYWTKAKEKGTDNPQIDKKITDKKLYD